MKRFCVALLLSIGCLCASAAEKSAIVVNINGSKYYIHTVQPGETLYGLAKTYAVTEKAIVGSNPSAAQGLQAGASLKIPFVADTSEQLSEKKLRKTFDMHYVAKGETLYGVSRQYAIPIPTIMEDNPSLDPIHLRPGQRILIRKKRIGSENEAGSKAQWEQYRASLNSVAAPGDAYVIVAPGETFYSISRRYDITEAELSQLNDGLQPADLKAGAMLRVPVPTVLPQPPAPEPTPVEVPQSTPDPFADRRIEEIEFHALRPSQTLNIALLLPLTRDDGSVSSNYLEFYQGFLLGLDSVKLRHGRSVDLTLFDTGRDPRKIEEIVATDEFRKSDLVVGPVYEEGIYPVIAFAEQKGIPVVSPLAQIERMNSDVLFQLAPDPAAKYDKAVELLDGDRRVTLIYTSNSDTEYEAEMLALLGDKEYRTHKYRYEHPNDIARREPDAPPSPADLTPLLTGDRQHLFIVMADNEVDVDRILAALASAATNITARTGTTPDFMVLGNSHWNRYNSIDRTMFFKDSIVFFPTYHAKRDSESVQKFDATYIRAFGALPTLYAYRGYDTAMIFGPAMYNDIEYDMEGRRYTPLQTAYVFSQPEGRHTHVNRNWTRVGYRSDFTISIE